SSGAQAYASWAPCKDAKAAPVITMEAADPVQRATAGYTNPRKKSSSTSGATSTPKAASRYPDPGLRKNCSMGRDFGVHLSRRFEASSELRPSTAPPPIAINARFLEGKFQWTARPRLSL